MPANQSTVRRVVVTGANGFIGTALVRRLASEPRFRVLAASRRPLEGRPGVESIHIDDIGPGAVAPAAIDGCDAVVHLAARVHRMGESADTALELYRAVNTRGTIALARQAAEQGVRRFIFISSIKVNGESTEPGQRFSADDAPAPAGSYAISKAAAEAGLLDLAARSSMDVTIVRPPLVYGPGAKANFLTMTRWLARGVPLPLGAVRDNRRSLVGLDNLVSLIVRCIEHPAAANEVFLAGDGEDLSTTDLLRRTAAAMGVEARLLPVPVAALRMAGMLVGKRAVIQRLCGSLQADIAKTRRLLDWDPPNSVDEGLRRAVGRAQWETRA